MGILMRGAPDPINVGRSQKTGTGTKSGSSPSSLGVSAAKAEASTATKTNTSISEEKRQAFSTIKDSFNGKYAEFAFESNTEIRSAASSELLKEVTSQLVELDLTDTDIKELQEMRENSLFFKTFDKLVELVEQNITEQQPKTKPESPTLNGGHWSKGVDLYGNPLQDR